jgi:glutathione S-transferase
MLELDKGSYLTETAAICEYLEELHPSPALIGSTSDERAETRMWLRRVELNVCVPAVHAFYYKEGYDLFKDRVFCIPEAAESLKTKARLGARWVDGLLAGKDYLAGARFTIADICLFTYLDLLRNGGQPLDHEAKNLSGWFERVASRPSAGRSLFPVQPMGLRG